MNTNPSTQENQKLKKKALSLLSRAIAKIMLKFRLPRNEFLLSLDENLVLQAKKEDPDASIVSIAIRTGINRRYINSYLKHEMPEAKPDKLAVILGDIRWTANKYYHSNIIPKKGPFKTFQSICEQRASGTLTYKSILAELVKLGNIKDLGDKIELINLKYNSNQDDINYSNITAVQLNRTIDTMVYNFDKTNKQDRLVQRTVYTTQVNPNKLPQLQFKLNSKISNYFDEITEIMIEFEDEVEVGTYPQYGISLLEYKTED